MKKFFRIIYIKDEKEVDYEKDFITIISISDADWMWQNG